VDLSLTQNEEGVLFFVMEYCDLPPLNNCLITIAMNTSDEKAFHGLILFLQILDGLIHLHSENIIDKDTGDCRPPIIHRDLKPQNIVLTSDLSSETTVVKIVDFGLSTEMKSTLTSQLGTLDFRSPELVNLSIS